MEERGAGHASERAAGVEELLIHCMLRRELRELLGGLALDRQLGEVLFVVRQGHLDRCCCLCEKGRQLREGNIHVEVGGHDAPLEAEVGGEEEVPEAAGLRELHRAANAEATAGCGEAARAEGPRARHRVDVVELVVLIHARDGEYEPLDGGVVAAGVGFNEPRRGGGEKVHDGGRA